MNGLSSRLLAIALTAAVALPAAHAQEPAGDPPAPAETGDAAPAEGEATEPPAADDAAAARPSNAAFMQPLGRLSSILGSMHFLRQLCGDTGAEIWRTKMNELLAAQEPNDADRRILIASFNSGFRAFQSTYRTCTPAAETAMRRYVEEGSVLSRDIGARYGN